MDKTRMKSLSPADSDLRLGEDRLFYIDGKSPRSNNSSSTEEGPGSSSSFDNSSAGSTCSSDLQGLPTRKNFTRTNHSEIEKKRRRKINKFIDELAELIPMGSNASRKPDKLTVVKMAVQHIRILGHRNEQRSSIGEKYKPTFVTEDELRSLLEEAAGGFIFVSNTDRFQLLHVSDTAEKYLTVSPKELIGKRLVDVVHPKDVPVLREELAPAHARSSSPSTRFVFKASEGTTPASTKNTFATTCRRAFFCRFKTKSAEETSNSDTSLLDTHVQSNPFQLVDDTDNYSIIHCVGYLKSWHPVDTPVFVMDRELDITSSSYFFAIGRKVDVLTERKNIRSDEIDDLQMEFSCRCTADGKYLHIDPRIVSLLGHLPQDLLGQKFYDFIVAEDRQKVQSFIEALVDSKSSEVVVTNTYHMVSRSGLFIPVITALHCFYNPITNDLEYVIHQSSLVV